MVDLFKDIPEEKIEIILKNIRDNLEKISLFDGHSINRHVDIQLYALKTRLCAEDLRFATSFYDAKIARMAAVGLLRQNYEAKIKAWLLSPASDVLILCANFGRALGYGYQQGDDQLHEGLSRIRIVLEKEEKREWGFRILTCYPIF